MTNRSRLSFILIGIIVLIFGAIKLSIVCDLIEPTRLIQWVEISCFITFIPLFYCIARDYVASLKETFDSHKYSERLTQTLIGISRDSMFFDGDVFNGAKKITKQIAESVGVDRCSIWLYNEAKTSIICEQLYVKGDDSWSTGIELFKKDFLPYFRALEKNPIIIAEDAETHESTACFTEVYLRPLGIKSMLDVPIIYRGEVIGVICIESLTKKKWETAEVNFAQTVSSLYSFAYLVSETNALSKDFKELEQFIDQAASVSKADKDGKITYVNKKFEQVSGWKAKEVIGMDNSVVNSGTHPKSFWRKMYRTVVKHQDVWNAIVTNQKKNGEIYHVDTYIKGLFDQETREFKGFMSIRNDVTEVVNALAEVDKKNTYLEHAAKIIRHDMHSGINTYIPRGISSLERRLTPEIIKQQKLEAPLRMLKEGLAHAQRVYKGVYEFTNLVKKNSVLEKTPHKLDQILHNYLDGTAYRGQVVLSEFLPTLEVNESLFCTAIDNLIRNGLKYNDSETKMVVVFMEDDETLVVQDNGRGLTQSDFEELSKPYTRKQDQKESGTGLGLNICIAILKEHGFEVSCEKVEEGGTKIKIKIK